MKKILSVLFAVIFVFCGCTSSYAVKNRALVLAAENLDRELLASATQNFVDLEQQKIFADFMKKNSRVDVSNVDVKGDEATAQLTVKTPAKTIYAVLGTISGKDWQAKVDASMETRHYSLSLKKTNDSWKITDQKEVR